MGLSPFQPNMLLEKTSEWQIWAFIKTPFYVVNSCIISGFALEHTSLFLKVYPKYISICWVVKVSLHLISYRKTVNKKADRQSVNWKYNIMSGLSLYKAVDHVYDF